MEISKEQLQSFIVLFEKKFGISLTPVEAQQKALSLLRFLAISVTSLDKKEDYDIIGMPDLMKKA